MAPACCAAPAVGRASQRVAVALPVAWLEGDVLAEYLLFLEETVSPPPVPVVAWLEGDVRDELLRFLDESRAAAALAAVHQERQQQEGHGRGNVARDGGGDAGGCDDSGIVLDDGHRSIVEDGGESGFMEDDAGAMEDGDESGDGGVCMEKGEHEADAVLELLLPHILDLPAFRARATAPPVQQEPALGFSCYRGGWLQNRVSLIEEDSCSSSSSSDKDMSSVEEIEEGSSQCDQQLASNSSIRNSRVS